MRMELTNFSVEIWGDFYNPDYEIGHEDRPLVPTTIAMALSRWQEDEDREGEWYDMAEELFPEWCEHQDPKDLPFSAVWELIQATNTAEGGGRFTPLKVWIDEKGDYTLDVYDESYARLLEFNLQGLRVLEGVSRIRDALKHYQLTSDHRSLRISKNEVETLRKAVVHLATVVDILNGDGSESLEAICEGLGEEDTAEEIAWYAPFDRAPY